MIAIVVPFRDDPHCPGARTEQLRRFIAHFSSLFAPDEARVIIVEQSTDSRRFNRGQLLNVGYALAARGMGLMNTADGCTRYRHVVFHDVDMLPDPSLKPKYLAPLLPSAATLTPKHLKGYMSSVQETLCVEQADNNDASTENESGTCMRIIFDAGNRYSNDACFGGVVIYDDSGMRLTNGYPNNFWGWGGEDNAMFARVVRAGVLIERVEGGTFEDLENLTLEAKMDALRMAGAKCKDKWKLLRWDKNKTPHARGSGETADQELHEEDRQSTERKRAPKFEPALNSARDSALKSTPSPAPEPIISEEATWNWQCNGLAQLQFNVLNREILRRSGTGPDTTGVAVALKVTVALGSALPDHHRCCECGRLLHESHFSGEQRRVAEWDRAKGKSQARGVALSGVVKGVARCMECVANDSEVQRARENAAKNQADLSRRTCTVCGDVFASRNKLFAHMASTTCGREDIDDGNTDIRGSVDEVCLDADMNASARKDAAAATSAAAKTEGSAGVSDITTVAAISTRTCGADDGESYGIQCPRCTLVNEYGAAQCSACGADLHFAVDKQQPSTKATKANDASGVNKDARVLQLGRLFPQASYELLTEALAKNVDDVNDAAAFLLAKGFGNGDIEGAAAAAGLLGDQNVAAVTAKSVIAHGSVSAQVKTVESFAAAGANSTVFAPLLPEALPRQYLVPDSSTIDSVGRAELTGTLPLPPADHAKSRAASGLDWLAFVLDSCDSRTFSVAQAVCRSWRTEAVRTARWRFTHLRACAERELRGHKDAVGVLVSIPPSCRWHDGSGIVGRWLLASGSEDFTVRIWDVHAGQASGCTPVALLEGHEQLVIDLAVDNLHGMLFSASYDSSVRVWQIGGAWMCLHKLQNKEIWRSFEHVHSVAVVGAGSTAAGVPSSVATKHRSWLCCGSDGGAICCWTLPQCEGAKLVGRHAARESGSSAVRALASRGSLLYSGGDDGAVCVWECSSTNTAMELRVRRQCHKHFVRALCLCAPSKGHAAARYPVLLASGSFDCTVLLSCAFTLEPVHVFAGQHTKVVRSLATSEHFLFSGSWDQRIAVFNINARVFEGRMLHAATYVNALAVLGDTLFSGSRQGYVRVWTPAQPMVLGLPVQPKSAKCPVPAGPK